MRGTLFLSEERERRSMLVLFMTIVSNGFCVQPLFWPSFRGARLSVLLWGLRCHPQVFTLLSYFAMRLVRLTWLSQILEAVHIFAEISIARMRSKGCSRRSPELALLDHCTHNSIERLWDKKTKETIGYWWQTVSRRGSRYHLSSSRWSRKWNALFGFFVAWKTTDAWARQA